MATRFVWLKHAEHGGVAKFPEASVPQWRVLGWEPCDPPAELDPRQDPRYVDLPPATPTPGAAAPVEPKTPAVAKPSGDVKKEKADG